MRKVYCMSIPPDFNLHYFWSGPTVRPPYHFEYTITIGPGPQGEVSYIPDYPNHNPPRWQEPFPVPQAALEKLYAMMLAKNAFRPAWQQRSPHTVGGEQVWMDASAGQQRASIPAGLAANDSAQAQPLYDAIRALAPQAVWDKLEAMRQKYIAAHLA